MSGNSYTIVQRAIFSLLEEAGSEDAAALVNTVFPTLRARDELKRVGAELLSLFELGVVHLRMEFDEALDRQKQMGLLLRFDTKFIWSDSEQIWKWQPGDRAEIVLTDFGKSEAEAVLTEHGVQPPFRNS